MNKVITTFISTLILSLHVFSQSTPFNILIEPMNITGLGGLQAYAFGQHNGKWLIVGGRLDGLHRRQPFAAFDIAGNNNQLIVVDPVSKQKWSAPTSSLSIAMQEHLSSTNMQFYQQGNYLYFIGGYGYNAASATKKTFDFLTAIDVPAVINAVISGTTLIPFFRQINDAQFAVTGGHLKKINNTFYLIGGNKFDGNYNPGGNPTYTQLYTNAIRKFNIIDNGVVITVTHLPTITDATNLHRRDYNAVAQIMPNGTEGVTAFSGVFQTTANLPFLNCVNIDSSNYSVNNTFQQYYNHYHCGVLPVYSASSNEMHNIFFGGIAHYFDSAGVLIKDDNVPFVKTIARVTRNSLGIMTEYKLPIEMPSLLGAGAEFIMNTDIPHFKNDVFKLDDFTTDTTLVGYIYGGISSTAANIFFTNNGTQSSASSQIFKIYILKNKVLSLPNHNQSITAIKNNSSIDLSWETFNDVDYKQLIVQFSNNGNNFTDIETLAVNCTLGQLCKYQFKHSNPNNGINYYRIKQIDKNKNTTFSKVAKVVYNENSFSIRTNLVNQDVYIHSQASNSQQLIFLNVFGQVVLTTNISGSKSISVSTLPAGLYFVKNNLGEIIKFIKQ
jgi:hypothetical protein